MHKRQTNCVTNLSSLFPAYIVQSWGKTYRHIHVHTQHTSTFVYSCRHAFHLTLHVPRTTTLAPRVRAPTTTVGTALVDPPFPPPFRKGVLLRSLIHLLRGHSASDPRHSTSDPRHSTSDPRHSKPLRSWNAILNKLTLSRSVSAGIGTL